MNLIKFIVIVITIVSFISCDGENNVSPDNKFGKIIGMVNNRNLEPIIGVELYTLPVTEVKINSIDGKYTFTSVEPGIYKIYAKKEGYKIKYVEISVVAGKTTEAIIILEELNYVNTPPRKPNLIAPENNSSTNGDVNFKWSCTDPENDIITFDLFLGLTPQNLELVNSNIEIDSYTVKDLTTSKKYYWKIIARDIYGESSESDVWNFYHSEFDNDNILLNLKLDGNLQDLSKHSFQLSSYMISYGKDRFGIDNSAVILNGYNSFFELAQNSYMDFSKPFAISLWLKPDPEYGSSYEGEVDVVSRYGAASSNTSSFTFCIQNSFIKAEIYNHQVSGRNVLTTNVSVQPNVWSHAVLVYNGYELIIYLNGQKVGSRIVDNPDKSYLPLTFGKRTTNNRFYKGSVDDIIIFKYAINDSEVKKLFN